MHIYIIVFWVINTSRDLGSNYLHIGKFYYHFDIQVLKFQKKVKITQVHIQFHYFILLQIKLVCRFDSSTVSSTPIAVRSKNCAYFGLSITKPLQSHHHHHILLRRHNRRRHHILLHIVFQSYYVLHHDLHDHLQMRIPSD